MPHCEYEYSFIVPVYNKEKYIGECIKSIVQQGEQCELILIDDGSTDSSGEICDKYAKEYKCVQVYHKENAGPAAARNFGCGRARGRYCIFVDADDYISENFIKQLDGDTDEKLSYEMNIKDAAMSYMLDYIKKGIAVPENVSFGEVKTHLEYVIRYGISEFVSNVLQLALVVDAHATQEFLRKIFLDVTVSDEIKSEIIRVYLVLGISIPVKCVSANLYKEFTIRSVRFAGYASSLFNLAYALAASTVYMIDNTKVSLLKSKAFKAQANYEERGGDEDD